MLVMRFLLHLYMHFKVMKDNVLKIDNIIEKVSHA